MSISTQTGNWVEAPSGHERLWIGLALSWCLVMFAMMIYWHFYGQQNATGESYAVDPDAFVERKEEFVANHKVGERETESVVAPPPGGDAYLVGRKWEWTPILKLRKGETYRLHVSSADLQHGFSVLPMNMNFQVLPGYDHVLTITPTERGEFSIICNEFCGIGHHAMTGTIIVE